MVVRANHLASHLANYLANHLWSRVWSRGMSMALLLLVVAQSADVAAANATEATRQIQGMEIEETEATTELPEEVPEEILRTEIITEARSPLTGEPLSAASYAQLQAELAAPAGGNLVNQDLRYLIYLLQLRRAVKPIIPFL
ncbi:MAG: hypothetical protein WBA76_07345 [Phormidesmis sp.]